MNHKQIINECERLGLKVQQVPSSGRRSYQAKNEKILVYWDTSYEGGLLGSPRIMHKGGDTHITSLKTIEFYLKLG